MNESSFKVHRTWALNARQIPVGAHRLTSNQHSSQYTTESTIFSLQFTSRPSSQYDFLPVPLRIHAYIYTSDKQIGFRPPLKPRHHHTTHPRFLEHLKYRKVYLFLVSALLQHVSDPSILKDPRKTIHSAINVRLEDVSFPQGKRPLTIHNTLVSPDLPYG